MPTPTTADKHLAPTSQLEREYIDLYRRGRSATAADWRALLARLRSAIRESEPRSRKRGALRSLADGARHHAREAARRPTWEIGEAYQGEFDRWCR